MRTPAVEHTIIIKCRLEALRADGENLEVTFVRPILNLEVHFLTRLVRVEASEATRKTHVCLLANLNLLLVSVAFFGAASCAFVFSPLAARARPLRYFHKDAIDPAKKPHPPLSPPPDPLNPPTHPDQFASSKTNIAFNQMQLGLQVKISSQLKFIRTIMPLGDS